MTFNVSCRNQEKGEKAISFGLNQQGNLKEPSVSLIAFTSIGTNHQQSVFIIKPDGTGLKNIAADGWWQSASLVSWAPDSASLFIASEHKYANIFNVYALNLFTSQITPITDFSTKFFGEFSCSPDGQSIFLIKDDQLYEKPISPSGESKLISDVSCSEPLCSPNGKRVSFLKWTEPYQSEPEIFIYSSIDHKVFTLGRKGGTVGWLTDDKLLFFSVKKGMIYQADVPSGEQQFLANGYNIKVSPNGKYVAFIGESDTVSVLNNLIIMDIATKQVVYIFNSETSGWEPPSTPKCISWSPDSKEFVFVGVAWDEEDIDARSQRGLDEIYPSDLRHHDSCLIKVNIPTKDYHIIHTADNDSAICNVVWSPK